MTRLRLCLIVGALALLAVAAPPPLAGQTKAPSPCPEMPALSYLQTPPAGDFLSPQQEGWLGEMIQAMVPQGEEFTAPAEVDHLRAVMARLEAEIPNNPYHFQVHLLDSTVDNAWVMPGGNIYITRPLIELMRGDDELAAVLAHEMGHEITRQLGYGFSQRLRRTFGIRAVGDRTDLKRDFNRYTTWAESHPLEDDAAEVDTDANQDAADHIALLLMAKAGYDPQAFPRIVNRSMNLKGRTGGALANLLGLAPPDEQRLHDALTQAAALEHVCATTRPADSGFAAWQTALMGAETSVPPSLPGLLRQTKLNPPLEANFYALGFSPNGRYLLVEDEGGIWVVTVNPPAIALHIVAPDAMDPAFTPDSAAVVFDTPDLRLERWDVAARRRTLARQFSLPPPTCYSALPAAGGERLACIRGNGEFDLLEAATGATAFSFQGALTANDRYALQNQGTETAEGHPGLVISPSGRYLLVIAGRRIWAVDAVKAQFVALGRNYGKLASEDMQFVNDHEVLAPGNGKNTEWEYLSFPAGATLRTVHFAAAEEVAPETSGEDLIVAPAGARAVGVVDPATGKFILNDSLPALDGYGDLFAGQIKGGESSLVRADGGAVTRIAELTLPAADLPAEIIASASGDLGRLALSGPKRGGLWELNTGREQVPLRNFGGAYLSGEQSWLEFPRTDKTPGRVFEVDLAARQITPGAPQNAAATVEQFGAYLATLSAKGDDLQFSDARTGRTAYSQKLWPAAGLDLATSIYARTDGRSLIWHERSPSAEDIFLSINTGPSWLGRQAPVDAAYTVSGDMALLAWPSSALGIDRMVPDDSALRRAKRGDRAAWVQEVDLATGKPGPGFMLNPAPNLDLRGSAVAAGRVFLSDGQNRILVYDPDSGERTGAVFGYLAASCAQWLAVQRGDHVIELRDAATLTTRGQIVLPSAVRLVQFSADGQEMLVLTSDQTAYIFATGAIG